MFSLTSSGVSDTNPPRVGYIFYYRNGGVSYTVLFCDGPLAKGCGWSRGRAVNNRYLSQHGLIALFYNSDNQNILC